MSDPWPGWGDPTSDVDGDWMLMDQGDPSTCIYGPIVGAPNFFLVYFELGLFLEVSGFDPEPGLGWSTDDGGVTWVAPPPPSLTLSVEWTPRLPTPSWAMTVTWTPIIPLSSWTMSVAWTPI